MSTYPQWIEDRFGNDIPAWAVERWGEAEENETSSSNDAQNDQSAQN